MNTCAVRQVPGCSRNTGVSLIEIMFATVIFAIATLAASGLLSFGHRGTQKDLRTVMAGQILTDRMNMILKIPFASVSANITTGSGVTTYSSTASQSLDFDPVCVPYGLEQVPRVGDFQVEIRLQYVPITFGLRPFKLTAGYASGTPSTYAFRDYVSNYRTFNALSGDDRYLLLKVVVTVRWTEPNGHLRNIDLVSFIADLERA